jgi:hypothetical protein
MSQEIRDLLEVFVLQQGRYEFGDSRLWKLIDDCAKEAYALGKKDFLRGIFKLPAVMDSYRPLREAWQQGQYDSAATA